MRRQRDIHDARQIELDSRRADVEAREEEAKHHLQLAVDIAIGQAELSAQMVQAKQQELENEAGKAELFKKSVELGERDAEVRVREESCATLVEDHSAVSRDVKYLQKQKEVLEGEIERMVKHHATLAATFHRLRAEVNQTMPVEP